MIDPVDIHANARRLAEVDHGWEEFAGEVDALLEAYLELRQEVHDLIELNPYVSTREWWQRMDRLSRLSSGQLLRTPRSETPIYAGDSPEKPADPEA